MVVGGDGSVVLGKDHKQLQSQLELEPYTRLSTAQKSISLSDFAEPDKIICYRTFNQQVLI